MLINLYLLYNVVSKKQTKVTVYKPSFFPKLVLFLFCDLYKKWAYLELDAK